MNRDFSQQNRRAYSTRGSVAWYRRFEGILPAERVILDSLRGEMRGKRLLDIGAGGGRTTPHLLEISSDYTAIDYVAPLVEVLRKKYGLRNAHECDARDMHIFPDGSFELAFFSFNGIDYVPHEGRLRILAEVCRVLRPGGIFVFSTHNLNDPLAGKHPWQVSQQELSISHLRMCLKSLVGLPRHWRMKRCEIRKVDYAILNDCACGYRLLAYYVRPSAQITQLLTAGFNLIAIYDIYGINATEDSTSPWLYYVARLTDKHTI
jgi:SAM-dependent methyltransferase